MGRYAVCNRWPKLEGPFISLWMSLTFFTQQLKLFGTFKCVSSSSKWNWFKCNPMDVGHIITVRPDQNHFSIQRTFTSDHTWVTSCQMRFKAVKASKFTFELRFSSPYFAPIVQGRLHGILMVFWSTYWLYWVFSCDKVVMPLCIDGMVSLYRYIQYIHPFNIPNSVNVSFPSDDDKSHFPVNCHATLCSGLYQR